jgi:hypothetical protein
MSRTAPSFDSAVSRWLGGARCPAPLPPLIRQRAGSASPHLRSFDLRERGFRTLLLASSKNEEAEERPKVRQPARFGAELRRLGPGVPVSTSPVSTSPLPTSPLPTCQRAHCPHASVPTCQRAQMPARRVPRRACRVGRAASGVPRRACRVGRAASGVPHEAIATSSKVCVERSLGTLSGLLVCWSAGLLGLWSAGLPARSPRVEAPRVEAPGVEAPRVEASRVETGSWGRSFDRP